MDDSTVSHTSVKTVLKQQAYILFYVRIPEIVVKPITNPIAAAAPVSASVGLKSTNDASHNDIGEIVTERPLSTKPVPTSNSAAPVTSSGVSSLLNENGKRRVSAIVEDDDTSDESTDSVSSSSDGSENSDSDASGGSDYGYMRLKKLHAWKTGPLRYRDPTFMK